ncbi:uncharacterized protein METZ01_LOCUS262107, partial [marine metagenome]
MDLAIRSLPPVVIDAKLADCCNSRGAGTATVAKYLVIDKYKRYLLFRRQSSRGDTDGRSTVVMRP